MATVAPLIGCLSALLVAAPALAQAASAPAEPAAKTGINLSLQEQSEAWANVTGGGKRGTSANGLFTASLAVDLDKTVHWSGANFFVSLIDIHGHGPSRALVGNLQDLSNIEASPSVKLFDLWLEQTLLHDRLSLRLGQENITDELLVTTYGGLFANASFGLPGLAAADLPSGGPTYPLAAPFARAQVKASDQITVVGAVFSGDPAPPGPGDPQIRDRNGTAFRLDDHALLVGELRYTPAGGSDKLPTVYRLGTWYHSGRFADQRFDRDGGLLADPASSGQPLEHNGDEAVYLLIDQALWRRAGTKDQGVGAFLQLMAAPSDRNLSQFSIGGGVNWNGPFAKRPDDVAGLAFAYLGISPAARRFGRDLVGFGRAASPYAAAETVIEATYSAPLTAWLTLQPDLQYVIAPGAGIPGRFGSEPLKSAFALGLRATLKF